MFCLRNKENNFPFYLEASYKYNPYLLILLILAILYVKAWVKVFSSIPKFRILNVTMHRKSVSKY